VAWRPDVDPEPSDAERGFAGLCILHDYRSALDAGLAGRADVAGFAAWLGWGPHVRGGMIYALAALAPLTILLDRILPAKRFEWTLDKPQEEIPHEAQDTDDGGGVRAHAAGS